MWSGSTTHALMSNGPLPSHLRHRFPQRVDVVSQQPTPAVLQVHGEEPASAVGKDTPIVGHGDIRIAAAGRIDRTERIGVDPVIRSQRHNDTMYTLRQMADYGLRPNPPYFP
jgi:hypothetical protein